MEISQNIQILSEKTLRDIAKGPLVQFALTSPENEKVNRVWQSLYKTLSTPSLSHQQIAAACNAVSAFVEAAAVSQNESTKQLALSSETWLAIFDIFLSRYDDVKPKPLKQNLGSITTILVKHYKGAQRSTIQAAILNAVLPSVIIGEPRSRLKGSLVCLEMFIRKRAVLPSELISLTRAWLLKHRQDWLPVFKQHWGSLSQGESDSDLSALSEDLTEELAAKVFFLGLLTQTNNLAMSGTSGSIMASLLRIMKSESPSKQPSDLWVAPVRHVMLQNPDDLEFLSNSILQPLFTIDPAGFIAFTESLHLKMIMAGDMTDATESEYMLLFLSLQMGKKVNLVNEDYNFNKAGSSKKDVSEKMLLKSQVIGKFMLHREPSIRIAALSLLVTAFSTSKPFTIDAARTILHGLPSMHADSDSHSRSEIMSLTRKFIIRLKSGILVEQDASELALDKTGNQNSGLETSDANTRPLLQGYLNFLQSDLCVTASYPRHISALKALKLLLDSGLDTRADIMPAKSEVESRWKFHMEVFSPFLLRLLVDLLLDPFDDVRQTSMTVINLFPQDVLIGGLVTHGSGQPARSMRLTDALARAESTASKTSRADHADSVARLYHILFCAALSSDSDRASGDWWATKSSLVDYILRKLEERLSSQKGLFNSSLREAPLHGYMSGLRYIVLMSNFHTYVSNQSEPVSWRTIHNRIVSICDKVWKEVKPVLCVDSPEGHSDEPTEELSVGPKDILSYSWRALRESSLLLHATMFNVTYGPAGEHGLQLEDFERVGKTSFIQLAELRHRGAFSTVSQTFATCCQRCSSSKDESIQELPRDWYQQAKATIFESAGKLTRRSAGLPALVTGILCSSPGTPFFTNALIELHDISRLAVAYDKDQQYLELPQVHSMNCLKDIFTNTKLSSHTESFVMPALTLSAERLGSPIWALRNSGLMLFRALLHRMCRLLVPGTGAGFGGVSGSEPGSKISFPKYPGLMELLSTLLAPSQGVTVHEGSDIVTERIFPALELIGEKIPTIADNYDTVLCDLVREHLKSPVWGIREHAARVYASLLTRVNILADVRNLVGSMSETSTENYLHGVALCVQYALRRFAATTDAFWTSHLDDVLATVRHILSVIFPKARSPFVANILVEILNDSLERSIDAGSEQQVLPAVEKSFEGHDLDNVLHYLFDASHQGWNLLSRTRASPLLRRALAWCTVLKMFASQEWDSIPTFFHAVSEFDPDAACWIAEKLQERLDPKEVYRKPLASLYSSVLLGKHSASVKIIAAANLTSILETLSSQPSSIQVLGLPYENLAKSFRPGVDLKLWNRPATDAALRLQGCLLATRASSNEELSLEVLQNDIQEWIVKLRSALSEETEFTTRYAAVVSLHSFSRTLRPSKGSARVDALLLDVYLVLYDLLNDDDEEIRDMAASTASWILSYSSVSPETSVALGPLNASSLLAKFIVEHYSASTQFARRVIRYLTGQETRISGSDEQVDLKSVPDLIAEFSQESTILFVEEKQNLFIDEVREVDVWVRAILHLNRQSHPEGLICQISSWASEGLDYLTKLVSQDAGLDGFLGWVSKPDSFILGVRLISISSALLSPRSALVEYMEVGPDTLRTQLRSFASAGTASLVHDEWLARIESGLNPGV